MAFFTAYCRERARLLLPGLLCLGVFALVFYLYRVPAGAILYPLLLSLLMIAVFFLWDYIRALKKHRQLMLAAEEPENCSEALPSPAAALEQDYQVLIQAMERSRRQAEERSAAGFADTIDYYTLWAHQIKTPIASMRLSLQNEDSAFSRQMGLELGRIERYVEMALTYLRLDSETSDYVIRPCALDGLLRGTLRKFAGEFIARKLRLDYPGTEKTALTDEKWLSFVVEQLLSNALKYTPAGTVSVTVEEPLTLCIRDTGIGISPEDLPRVFEKGYTGYLGREDKRASGIGLYLCGRICKNLGHRIRIESEPGRGTAVFVELDRKAVTLE